MHTHIVRTQYIDIPPFSTSKWSCATPCLIEVSPLSISMHPPEAPFGGKGGCGPSFAIHKESIALFAPIPTRRISRIMHHHDISFSF